MNKTVIRAEVVAHSLNPQGDELISLSITFPRIILAEINTHRMLSKNTSSSRAIPFKKMVEAVQNDPFIPIAWQKLHSGMQGNEYFTKVEDIERNTRKWLTARDNAINSAKWLNAGFAEDESGIGVTKQLCNRLLEPFMWTTMLITGSKEGWDNFFRLRCPQYLQQGKFYKSKKDAIKNHPRIKEGLPVTELDWLKVNAGQAEIHIMDLAEKIYDAVNESTPKQLKSREWHIPYGDTMEVPAILSLITNEDGTIRDGDYSKIAVKVSTAMAARESYTVVGNDKNIDYQKQLDLHDRLIEQDPPHSSPLEHCNRAMTDEEYKSFIKGSVDIGFDIPKEAQGWCNNIKGFIPYRYLIDTNLKM